MKSGQLDDGPIMIIVFGCLAVTLSFISFGLGFVNLAKAKGETDKLEPIKAELSEGDRLEAARVKQDIQRLESELDQLSAQIGRAKAASPAGSLPPDEAREQLLALQQRSTELQTQIAGEEARVAELRGQLAGKETAAQEAEFRVADVQRQINVAEQTVKDLRRAILDKQKMDATRLGGSMKNPQFVECRSGEIVLQPQGERITTDSIKHGNTRFAAAMRGREVFFLVRPSGFESFDAALEAAEKLGSTVGYEPVEEDWEVKFR